MTIIFFIAARIVIIINIIFERMTEKDTHTHTHTPVSYTHLTLPTTCGV